MKDKKTVKIRLHPGTTLENNGKTHPPGAVIDVAQDLADLLVPTSADLVDEKEG